MIDPSSEACIKFLNESVSELQKVPEGDIPESAATALKLLNKFDKTDPCLKEEGEVLADAAQKEVFFPEGSHLLKEDPNFAPGLAERIPHMVNGVILVVCGFLAPAAEAIVRSINNLLYLFALKRAAPKFTHFFHEVYELSHLPLQHLTQFKLYLVFLQTLLSINVAGIEVIKTGSGEGIAHFVQFVAWSIFINTVVKKVEKPIIMQREWKGSFDFLQSMLAHPEWLPKVLSAQTGQFTRAVTIGNVVKLYGFFMFFTLPVFTLVFKWTPTPNDPEMQAHCHIDDLKTFEYYTTSFAPIIHGFYYLREYHFSVLMTMLLIFQLLLCNLALPLFQLVHGVVQEIVWHYFPKNHPAGWRATESLLDNGRKAGVTIKRSLHPSQATWTRCWITLFLECCVENQAHEYFVCAFVMLLFVVKTILKTQKLNKRSFEHCGDFSVSVCLNPVICIWLLLSVPLLGRARAKLHVIEEEMGAFRDYKQKFKRLHKLIGIDRVLLLFWAFTAILMAIVLIFSDDDLETYFGKWTVSERYVKDSTVGGDFQCFAFVDGNLLPNSHCMYMDWYNDAALDLSLLNRRIQRFVTHMLKQAVIHAPEAEFEEMWHNVMS